MRSEMSKTSETGAKADLARTSLLQCIESHEGKFTEYGSMNYAIHTKMGSMVLERDMETPSAQPITIPAFPPRQHTQWLHQMNWQPATGMSNCSVNLHRPNELHTLSA